MLVNDTTVGPQCGEIDDELCRLLSASAEKNKVAPSEAQPLAGLATEDRYTHGENRA